MQEIEQGETRVRLDLSSASISLERPGQYSDSMHAAARFSESFSHFEHARSVGLFDGKRLVRWFLDEYLRLLVQYSLDIIFASEGDAEDSDQDNRRSVSSLASISTQESATNSLLAPHGTGFKGERAPAHVVRWIEQDDEMAKSGYDSVSTVSEHTLNAAYASLWKNASRDHLDEVLLHGAFETDEFHALFRPLKVRLLSNGKAVVWVYIDEGECNILR